MKSRGRQDHFLRGLRLGSVVAVIGLALAPSAAAAPLGQITESIPTAGTPYGIATGSDGNVWVGIQGSTPAIDRVTPSGVVTSFSTGLQPSNGSSIQLLAAGPDGNVWFTDPGKVAEIGRITPSGTITEFPLPTGAAAFGLAVGPDGNLWFTDVGKQEIGRITPSGTVTEYSTGLNTGTKPQQITAGPDGNMWFTDAGSTAAIGRITTTGTPAITEFPTGVTGSSPGSITAGPDGNIWFGDDGSTKAIGRITLTGTVTEFSTGLISNTTPTILAAGPDGNVWFADAGHYYPGGSGVGRITPNGTITEFENGLAGKGGDNSHVEGLASGPDGNMWFTDQGTNEVGTIGTGVGGSGPSGKIYWADNGTKSIDSANLDGTGTRAIVTGLSSPHGVAVDGHHIYWADDGTGKIGVANLDGTQANPNFITTGGGLSGIAVNDHYIYFMNNSGNTIGRADLDGTNVLQSFITGVSCGVGLAVDGQHIYWANFCPQTIGRANLDGTGVNQNLITGASSPGYVAVDNQRIYWANGGQIAEASLDGTNVDDNFIRTDNGPFGLAVDNQRIYWANCCTGADTLGAGNLDGTGVDQGLVMGANNPVGLAVDVPQAVVSPATPSAFSAQPEQTLSGPETLTLSNNGQRPLTVSGLSFGGADPADFVVTSNTCLDAVSPGESCQLTVAFAPQAPGARSATLEIFSNDYANSPLQVPLSGTGGQLPQGPAGTNGTDGASGANGATGASGQNGAAGASGLPGPPGQIELVTCKTVTKTITRQRRKVKVNQQQCSGRLTSGTVSFTTGAERDTLSRAGILYATGSSAQAGGGRHRLALVPMRRITPGRYTLTRTVKHGARWTTHRTRITIA